MARITITVVTTLHGAVSIDQHFDETFVEDKALCDAQPTVHLTCVADAVRRAGEAITAAHGEHLVATR